MDLRRRLGEVLDQAAAGERIVIERDRRPMAVLVPYTDGMASDGTAEQRRLRVHAALASIDRFARRMREKHPDGPDAVAAVRHDRDHADRSDDVRDHGR